MPNGAKIARMAAWLAILATLSGPPAQAITMAEFLELPDEIRFSYVIGLADGMAAGQTSIADRNLLSGCLTDFGLPALHDEMQEQARADAALLQMDAATIARRVIDAQCDNL